MLHARYRRTVVTVPLSTSPLNTCGALSTTDHVLGVQLGVSLLVTFPYLSGTASFPDYLRRLSITWNISVAISTLPFASL